MYGASEILMIVDGLFDKAVTNLVVGVAVGGHRESCFLSKNQCVVFLMFILIQLLGVLMMRALFALCPIHTCNDG